jgi:hypothetical protein
MIHRRDALRALALGGVGAAALPLWVERLALAAERHAGTHQAPAPATRAWMPAALDAHQNETVTALAELIVPQTDTPGAKAARVNEFIDAVLADAADAERRSFIGGLKWIDARSQELFGSPFVRCAPDQQTALLTILSSPSNTSLADRPGVEFFGAIKAMTITGYYTSEAGMKSELGDDGTRFFADYPGCQHPQHKS